MLRNILLLSLQISLLGTTLAGNILIWPMEGSHWLNVKIIIDELIKREHNVTVLVASGALFITPSSQSSLTFEIYKVSFGKERMEGLIKDFVLTWLENRPSPSTIWRFYQEMAKVIKDFHTVSREICDGVLRNEKLMDKLKKSKFEVLVSDPVFPCGDIVALKLGIPFIYSLRFSPASNVEKHCGKVPYPPSYVPAILSELTDQMTFADRVRNFISYHLQDYMFETLWKPWDAYYTKELDGSHWLNLKTLLEELAKRGHEVTVLSTSNNLFIDYNRHSAFNFEVIPVPTDKNLAENRLNEFVELAVNVMPTVSLWESGRLLQQFFIDVTKDMGLACRSTVYNQSLMKKLQESKYDVLITDPVLPCGELVAEMLGIPFVNTLRFFTGYTVEKYCGQLPAPPSYVPVPLGGLTTRMTFMERVKNMMFSILFDFWIQQYDYKFWDQFYSEALGRPTTLCEIMGKAEIWLIRTYWDFEFPRPYLPNFEFVGGLHCKPAKPLPKVLWRYKGKEPATLGPNTRLFDWIPQNDLLGHPKTKAFITHGGTNGIYEAIYHGVPMVGVPMFADQPDNIAHMKAKGAAVEVNMNTMTSADLLGALRTVINDPSYKENAMRLSRIHHDQPVKPLDRAVFWIEFVMRHKGAKHLRVAAHDLSWFQYHSLDVIGFLLVCVASAILLVTKGCLFFYQKFINTGKKIKRE
ncbi:UDP-glucuronosyltransferase 2A3 isoform X2 [Cavia porcellus]|uniref:UDP-glucuronosyltransferase 2A3 isoform X2 n=1 Tax=Cavia porcellus TaxID=10141 RepID=UPI00035091EE|nr:UDP-glucuronosyltransferase 2A3 isoform X1 [Cavia porcellus]